jgi:hypothetical protein
MQGNAALPKSLAEKERFKSIVASLLPPDCHDADNMAEALKYAFLVFVANNVSLLQN